MRTFEIAIRQLLNMTDITFVPIKKNCIFKNNLETKKNFNSETKKNGYLSCRGTVLSTVQKTNMFYIPDLDLNEGKNIDLKNNCSPFEFCWFELGNGIEFETPAEFQNKENKVIFKNYLMAIGLYELSPQQYMAVNVIKNLGLEKATGEELGYSIRTLIEPFDFCNEDFTNVTNGILTKFIKAIFSRLDKKNIHYVQNARKIIERGRIDGKFIKIKYAPKDVIYLSNIKKLKKDMPGIVKKIINKPSYAYEVMGHWRKVSDNTIGKNRQGERGVHGFTWINAHTRGKGELIKKVRILTGGKEDA